jgi:uncharacterized membrane protein
MTKQDSSPFHSTLISKARLEFLWDGIFAIAMTILVLELRVPDISDRRSSAELLRELAHHAPAFGSWLLSFVVLSVFWYNHQREYRYFDRITRASLVIHLWLMASAAFFPFCAALLGRYPFNAFAMRMYIGCIWFHVAGTTTLWVVAERQAAFDSQLAPAEIRRIRNRFVRATIILLALAVFYPLVIPSR